MTPLVAALVLFSAGLHASWNAILRGGGDRLWALTVMSYATTVVALPLAACLPAPLASSWPYLVASALLQIAYGVLLTYAYRFGELGQVYPIIRGSVPPFVALGALAFAGQRLSPMLRSGVVLISGGVVLIGSGRARASARSMGLALGVGLLVAAYVTIDGLGVRLAGGALSYTVWICIVYGAVMPLTYRLVSGRFAGGLITRDGVTATAGGIFSLVSYGAMVSALALGPLAPVSALRELSVVFSVVLGRVLLSEALTLRRVLAAAVVTSGAIVIGFSG